MCNLHWLHFVFLLPSGPSGTDLQRPTHKKAINQSTIVKLFLSYLRPFIQNLLSDILMLLLESLLPFTLCIFQLYTHRVDANVWNKTDVFRHCDIKWWSLKVHCLPVWCTAPPHWQTICWSPASLCGQKKSVKPSAAASGGKSVVLSDLWWPNQHTATGFLSFSGRHLLLCHVLVFGLGFVDLLLPLLVHFLLKVLLFSLESNTERVKIKNTKQKLCSCLCEDVDTPDECEDGRTSRRCLGAFWTGRSGIPPLSWSASQPAAWRPKRTESFLI